MPQSSRHVIIMTMGIYARLHLFIEVEFKNKRGKIREGAFTSPRLLLNFGLAGGFRMFNSFHGFGHGD
jgi:hypothetical protein